MAVKGAEEVGNIITSIVQGLVDQADKVQVLVTTSDKNEGSTAIYTIVVARGELGQVIGKHGRTIQALRSLMESIAGKHRLRAIVEVRDEEQNKA